METHTYVAIKSPGSSVALAAEPTRKKRKALSAEATQATEPRRQALEEAGLDEVPMQEILQSEVERVPPMTFSRLGSIGAYIVRAPEDQLSNLEQIFGDNYHMVPNVALSLPTTQGVGDLVHRNTDRQWPEASGITRAHEMGLTGGGVIIAVLDTGCDADHVQFERQTIDFSYFPPTEPQRPRVRRGFDPEGHGTHVSGIIAGNAVGIAPEVQLLVASVIESEQTTTSLMRIVAALEWISNKVLSPTAADKAVILNMSLGFRPQDVSDGTEGLLLRSLRDLMTTLADGLDILPVVAVGNDAAGSVRFPGGFPEVLAVGAVDFQHAPWYLSGGGELMMGQQTVTKPDVAGYGVDVFSAYGRTIEGHSRYARRSGTSMAAPYVSGVAALVAQQHNLTGAALRQRLVNDTLPLNHPLDRVGRGLVRFLG